MDVDLLLYNEDGSLADYSYTSNSTSTRKIIALPDTGTFYAVVKANEGHSKYVLSFGSNVSGASSFSTLNENYAKDRFISYIPFGPDYEYDQADAVSIDVYPQPDIETKFVQLNDDGFKGLRRFNLSIQDEFERLFSSSHLDNIQNNQKQVEYIKHWKVLQHYRELYPKLNLELDLKAKAMNFTQDPSWVYQWNLQQIGLETALTAIGQETKDVAVAVLDSGAPSTDSTAYTTSAFLPDGFDFVPFSNSGDGDDYDSDPTDSSAATDSHGTHVGTTIAALNDGNNINGLSPEERSHLGIFLAFQYPVEIPGVSNEEFLRLAYNLKRKSNNLEAVDPIQFFSILQEKLEVVGMETSFLNRNVNEGFSGGEKKRNEILQMAILDSTLSILDETDSGLDIDALRNLSEGINKIMNPTKSIILITHYQRLLDYIKPDYIHIIQEGKIIKTGDASLAKVLEKKGYEWLRN
jgi:Fe-S cluster assembly ATP-binding protein